MKIFANKSIWKKFLIIVGVIAVIAIVFPKPVGAFELGGVLMEAIGSFFMGLADGVMTLIHKLFANQDKTIYPITEGITAIKVVKGVLKGIGSFAAALPPIMTYMGTTKLINIPESNKQIEFQKHSPISSVMINADAFYLPDINITPYEIFTDENGLFNVNFFNTTESNNKDNKTLVMEIGQTIRNWYLTLTQIAIVGMLSVLVYIGIRMTLSSVAESKAKYKQMLGDWLIAICLIFAMRYIMVFSNLFVNQITKTIGTLEEQKPEIFYIGVKEKDNGELQEDNGEINVLVKKAYSILVGDKPTTESQKNFQKCFYKDVKGTNAKSKNDANVIQWPARNFAEQARLRAQVINDSNGSVSFDYIGFVIIYCALTIYTCIFIFVYIRRFIYMTFLTLISPLVALTYPIDKVKDGQAQAFNYWFREYLYNLLIQPLHLLIYMVLIGSAMEFASNNPLYVIICLGFMVPAEKLLKEMFGFKGKTPGSIPGMATAALMMEGTRRLLGNKGSKGGSSGGKNSNSKDSESESSGQKIRSADTYNSDLFDGEDQNQLPDSTQPEDNQTIGSQMREAELEEGGTPSSEDYARWDNEANNENLNSGNNTSAYLGYLDDVRNQYSSAEEARQAGEDESVIEDAFGGNNSSSQINNNEQEMIPSSEDNTKNRKNKVRVGGVVGAVGKTLGRKIANKEMWKNTGKSALKMAAGLGIGAIGMTAGGMAGIVSGDASKAFSNMTSGAALGYLSGSRIGESAINTVGAGIAGVSNFANEVRNEYYVGHKKEKEEKEMQESIKQFKKDNKRMTELRKVMDDDKMYENLVKGNGIDTYMEYGIDNTKDMAALEYFIKENEGMRREQAITVYQMNKDVTGGKRFDKLSKKNQDDWRQTMAQNFRKSIKNKGMSQEQIDTAVSNNVNKAENYITQFGKIRSRMN